MHNSVLKILVKNYAIRQVCFNCKGVTLLVSKATCNTRLSNQLSLKNLLLQSYKNLSSGLKFILFFLMYYIFENLMCCLIISHILNKLLNWVIMLCKGVQGEF